jgi:hypothetical protein
VREQLSADLVHSFPRPAAPAYRCVRIDIVAESSTPKPTSAPTLHAKLLS